MKSDPSVAEKPAAVGEADDLHKAALAVLLGARTGDGKSSIVENWRLKALAQALKISDPMQAEREASPRSAEIK